VKGLGRDLSGDTTVTRTTLTALAIALGLGALAATPSTATAGPPDGPLFLERSVPANHTYTLTLTLRGNEWTTVNLSGDGDTCLELRVYDRFDNLIASDTLGFGDDRLVRFRPGFTGQYKIKVKNIGNVYNKFVMSVR
jgi:hypothetical protein